MHDTIYWAALLTEKSSALLKTIFKPEHPKVFAEHVTLCFNPTEEQEKKWTERLGETVELQVIGEGKDKKGHAVIVSGIVRDDGGIPHISISCAEGVKPFYSNALLAKGYSETKALSLTGVISKFTKNGWETE